ncbi:hypothetical protein KEM48_013513 [Puccinia striiformis f. sp. tritici PST-130]|nr:hypothetical protein KEM48_013513 [Puccinia striiformis f. sp. tritici PST-130]
MHQGPRKRAGDNITSQAIMDALGADDDDSSDEADSDSSSDEEDLNTDLIFYLQAVHSQRYFGPRRRLALAPDNSDWLMNRLDDRRVQTRIQDVAQFLCQASRAHLR